jgi:hypothetical protein
MIDNDLTNSEALSSYYYESVDAEMTGYEDSGATRD